MEKNIGYIIIILLIIQTLSAKAQPDNIALQAVAAFESGNYAKAESLFEQCNGLTEADLVLLNYRAKNYKKQNKTEQALKLYEQANLLNTNAFSFEIAECYAQLGNSIEAVKYLKANLQSKYKKSETEIRSSSAFSSIEKTTEWKEFRQSLKANYTEQAIAKANYAINYDRFDEAVEILEPIISGTENAEVGLQLSKAYMLQGRHAEALRLLKSNPEKSEVYFKLLAEVHEKSGNYSDAFANYLQLKQLNPYNIILNEKAAKVALRAGKLEEALGLADTFLIFYPKTKSVLMLKAEIHTGLGDVLAALKIYNALLSTEPMNNELLVNRGKAYLETSVWRRAETDFSMALDVNPKQAEVYYLRGEARFKQNKLAEACMDWQQAQKMAYRKSIEKIQANCK